MDSKVLSLADTLKSLHAFFKAKILTSRPYNNKCFECDTKSKKYIIATGTIKKDKEILCFCSKKTCKEKYNQLKSIIKNLIDYKDTPIVNEGKKYYIKADRDYVTLIQNVEGFLCMQVHSPKLVQNYDTYMTIDKLYRLVAEKNTTS